jgi:hypothetical protein
MAALDAERYLSVPWSHGGNPWEKPWVSHGFPMGFHGFDWVSHGFPMVLMIVKIIK